MSHMDSVFANKAYLEDLISSCSSKREVLEKAGLNISSANYRTLNKWANAYGLSLIFDRSALKRLQDSYTRYSDEDVFVEDSKYKNAGRLKLRFTKISGVNQCAICGLGEQWQGNPLVLHLDHINGKHSDNRLENLRLLCPNCHSQTETFGTKRFKGTGSCNSYSKDTCKCGRLKLVKSANCATCRPRGYKIDWPSNDYLIEQVSKLPMTQVAKELGVSDNAVRKRVKKILGIGSSMVEQLTVTQ